MSSNTVRNILSIWIFGALIALGVGLALFINKLNTAPEDSQASALAGATIELGVKQRSNVSIDNQLLFNVGDTVGFTVSLPTFPSNTGHDTLVLRVQYAKANFEAPANLFVYDTTKFFAVSSTLCTPINATYECRRMDFTKPSGSAAQGEMVTDINLIAKTVTPVAGAPVLVFPATVAAFNPAMHSYIANSANTTDPLVFAVSPKANKNIRVEDQCYGDYNRLKGVSSEIVDPLDLSRFASKYGTPTQLQGADAELDIDPRGSSAQFLNASDLSVFASNYGVAACNRNRSDGLP